MRWWGKEEWSNACRNSGTHSEGAKANGKETKGYSVKRGDPVERRWGHGETTDGCKDSGTNGGGIEVCGKAMRRCGKRREDAGKMRPDENAGGVVQMLAGTKSGGDAEMGLGDGGTSGDDDSGRGMSPDDDEWPERDRGMASANGGLMQSCRITFDKDNPVGFALRGAAVNESVPIGSEPGSDSTAYAQTQRS
jgi:hypothetical protein